MNIYRRCLTVFVPTEDPFCRTETLTVDPLVQSSARSALLVVDMITAFDFEDGPELYKNAVSVAPAIGHLADRFREAGLPVIFVNDNHGHWKDDLDTQIEMIERNSAKGSRVLRFIRPHPGDIYVLKPQRSGFYQTPLEFLLQKLDVGSLVITGVTTDICVFFTAHDAYMRGFRVKVPEDCCAAVRPSYHTSALMFMRRVANASTESSVAIDLSDQ